MHILVTGAAGFIGAAVSDFLLRRGDSVIGIDNLDPYYSVDLKRARLTRLTELGGEQFTFVELDFADMAALDGALENRKLDRIVHLGAQPGVRYSLTHPHAYARTNLVVT